MSMTTELGVAQPLVHCSVCGGWWRPGPGVAQCQQCVVERIKGGTAKPAGRTSQLTRTDKEWRAIIAEVEAIRKRGGKINEYLQGLGVHDSTYYVHRRRLAKE